MNKNLKLFHRKKYLIVLTVLLFLDLMSINGTVSSLRLANPDNIRARELAFRMSDYDCNDPRESLRIPYIFSGVKKDYLQIMKPINCGWSHAEFGMINDVVYIITLPLFIIDMPVSLVTDTLVLPFTISRQMKEGALIDPPYFTLGNIQRKSGDNAKAKEYYEKGFKILPKYYGTRPYYEIYHFIQDFDDVMLFFARDYEQSGEYDNALFYYNNLIETATRYEDGPSGPVEARYKDLGRLYSKMGNHNKAEECYRLARENAIKHRK